MIACGTSLLVASTFQPFAEQEARRVTASPAAAAVGVVSVEPLDPAGPRVTGVVLDDDGHVAVSLAALGGSAELRVECDRTISAGRVLVTDPGHDLAVVSLAGEPTGRPLAPAHGPVRGELTLTSVTPEGHRLAHTVLAETRTSEAGEDDLVARGSSVEHGVLTNAEGELVGWVEASPGEGTLRATTAEDLLARARALLVEAEAQLG